MTDEILTINTEADADAAIIRLHEEIKLAEKREDGLSFDELNPWMRMPILDGKAEYLTSGEYEIHWRPNGEEYVLIRRVK